MLTLAIFLVQPVITAPLLLRYETVFAVSGSHGCVAPLVPANRPKRLAKPEAVSVGARSAGLTLFGEERLAPQPKR